MRNIYIAIVIILETAETIVCLNVILTFNFSLETVNNIFTLTNIIFRQQSTHRISSAHNSLLPVKIKASARNNPPLQWLSPGINSKARRPRLYHKHEKSARSREKVSLARTFPVFLSSHTPLVYSK